MLFFNAAISSICIHISSFPTAVIVRFPSGARVFFILGDWHDFRWIDVEDSESALGLLDTV